MKKFEYLVVNIGGMRPEQYGDHVLDVHSVTSPLMYKLRELSELGEQGWELVSVSNDDGDETGIMKREAE